MDDKVLARVFQCLQKEAGELGFTLLEVLVALIILGISFGVVFQTLSQSRKISWRSDELMAASRIAHNLLLDSRLTDTALQEGEVEEDVAGEEGWKFSFSAQPLALKGDDNTEPIEIPFMFEMRLCLSHEINLRKRHFCLTRWYRR